ncbi:Spc7-domain-containing protein [Mytilinidion resinicola]|uniref:Spc7-domain-containing protein n=1 Tax=Mytilinidion resinicola TaxID=574789 RepID=A0A6A6Z2J5_9PEZI|nr:Spc7-domain-containing protein [Mytilinidion resinicola]KAF2814893.1 Spc7-domain-containing protein [Mytilinidion resinicola]
MATEFDKENIAAGLTAASSFKPTPSLSPKKPAKKTRSKSIGPGGLGALEEPLKENSGNRRKSAFIPAVKSILASNDEDEKKRREARRKSLDVLARRRVSFAPEATLHTWDVIEYMRDATTSSSASSDATRRASSVSQASSAQSPQSNATSPGRLSDPAEPPSTPPEQIEEPVPGSSPAKQRDLHQKKRRRRSSGIPPMNFNNPDDAFSSSPFSGSGGSPTGSVEMDGSSDEDMEDTMMSLDAGDMTGRRTSARLEEAFQRAAAQAGTRGIDFDENGDISMELADEEVTAAFKPWAKRTAGTPKLSGTLSSAVDQENFDPFSPAISSKPKPSFSTRFDEPTSDGEDMSMDITRAVGKIILPQPQDPPLDDVSMDLTMALGKIEQPQTNTREDARKSLKRRRSSMVGANQGSPATRPSSRRSSLRKRGSPAEDSSFGDETMDLTMAIGGIQSEASQDDADRRSSIDLSFGEETMDFTMVLGGIKEATNAANIPADDEDQDENEDLSMEFTTILGGIRGPVIQQTTPPRTLIAKASAPLKAPSASPKKSPARSKISDIQSSNDSPTPKRAGRSTPQKSPRRTTRNSTSGTSAVSTPQDKSVPELDQSPFARRPKLREEAITTPQGKDTHTNLDDPMNAPILNRRLSATPTVHFSPIPAIRADPIVKSTAALSNSIRLLSTPRKQTLASPTKRGATPKTTTTPRKTPTPKKAPASRKSLSPKKRVVFGETSPVKDDEAEPKENAEDEKYIDRIPLQEFLDMTNIRFMDLTTTKRRHTAVPASFHIKGLGGFEDFDEKEETLENYVAAAACTVPEYEMYQHACHELKRYISGGRDIVRQIEADVHEENPALFGEYMSAPPDQRIVMDNQFKNMKTYARLQSKEIWYGWRSTLLRDLKAALLKTASDFNRDDALLRKQENLLDASLPELASRHADLETECKQLQQRQDELTSCDREELETARENLIAFEDDIEQKRRLVASLKQDLLEKESRIEAAKARKIECAEEIKAADRVREECRGWSASEVNALKAKVTALEQAHGWSITSASSSPSTITMTHLNDLELYFYPESFATGKNTPNASISLSYVGDSATPHPRPMTTSKRFFLQLLRAHLQCLSQSQTSISDLLMLIKNSWATARAVAEGVQCLSRTYITEESILSDERIAIRSAMLLPTLQTKVKVTFEVGVGIGNDGVETSVSTKAEVVYGEKYKEDKMREFLSQYVGDSVKAEDEMKVWADAVLDLTNRLRSRGRKV